MNKPTMRFVFSRINYFLLTYVYVSNLLLLPENI